MHHDAHTTLDMSISEAEFSRLLRHLPNESESLDEETPPPAAGARAWSLHLLTGRVRITFRSSPPRRIAALTLPRARIELDMRHLPPAARAAFLARFRRHFQRGGG